MNNIKKKMIIIIPILVLVIIAIIITIVYFTTDLLKSNEELFWKYFSQSEDINDILVTDKIIEQEKFKKANSYTSNGNIEFVLTHGEDSYKQFNVSTSARHDSNTNRTYKDAILKNGELELFKVSYINSSDIYGIKCDDVFGSYVGIQNSNLTELASNYGIQNMPSSIEIDEFINLLELNDAQKQHLVDTYLPIITNHINSEQYEKTEESIDINGNNYNANIYRVDLTSDVLYTILVECLNTLKTDTETLMIITSKLSNLGFSTEYTDNANIIAKIDELIENLQIEDNLTISVYENDGNNIRTNIILGEKANVIYDRLENSRNLSIDISYQKSIKGMDSDEVIDLNTLAESSYVTTRIVINRNVNTNNVTNNIQIIPNIQNLEEQIALSLSMGNIQNDSIANSYSISINKKENEKQVTTTINYDNNIAKADTVEEIEELSGSNTAIANNYTKEQFSAFIKRWTNIFVDKLSEEMTTLGLEEISRELDQINLE